METMEFGKPVEQVIRRRVSVRTYKKGKLPEEVREQMAAFLEEISGPFQPKVRLKLVDAAPGNGSKEYKLGTYGVIRGASAFIAGAVEKGDRYLEQYGYVMEKAILHATSLGLGTCWLGGTFNKSEFAKAIGLCENEILPAVTPIGYAEEKRSLVDAALRFTAGSKHRKKWEELFFDGSFTKSIREEAAAKDYLPLEMVRLAPSASNKQPWRIVREHGNYHLYLQHAKGYSNALGFDIQKIDMGIAMCHFELAMLEIGEKGNWSVKPPETGKLPENTEYVASWISEK
jgi:nitroreductase